ncbi:MAG: hypothetical protein AAB575_01695 [Patescibacteria group bacterium]
MIQEQPQLNNQALLHEVEECLEEMERILKERDKEEAYFESRRKPLPEKIYHVTTKENAEQIMREGLDPAKLYFENREVVSLSDEIDFALIVASATKNKSPEKLVILEIDTKYLTPSRIHNYLRREDPNNPDRLEGAAMHEIHYESTIPPEAMRIVKREK